MAALAEKPCSSIRRLAGSRSREVQFHRFLRNSKVTVQAMAEAAGGATGLCAAGRDIAVIHDTSDIYVGSGKAGRAGFGPIGKGGRLRGVVVHAAIAVDARGGLLGLVDQEVWTRSGGTTVTNRKSRAFADKESVRWLKAAQAAATRLPQARSITMVSDAESDIYAYFAQCPGGLHVVVRSARERRLENGALLSETVRNCPVAAVIERAIPASPGRAARTARLALRFCPVGLKAPEEIQRTSMPQRLGLHAIDVQEIEAARGVDPIHWLVLTSHAIADAGRAAEIVELYRSRFLIEQLFRTLKTAGIDIEEAEIADPKAMITFTGLAVLAAVNILQLVKARDGLSGQALTDAFGAQDQPLLKAISRRLEGKTEKQKNPHPPDTLAFASWVIARLGGWTGYYGKPGPQTMRHGLDRFHAIKLGAEAAKDV